MIDVVFDTNIIRSLGWRSALVRSLFALAQDGAIKVHVPDFVCEELRTQWRDEFSKRLDEAKKSHRLLSQTPLLPATESKKLETIQDDTARLSAPEDTSRAAFDKLFSDSNVNRLPITPDQSARAWASYFNGSPPFGSVKSRDDLPDAHIFECIKDLSEMTPGLIVLCGDKRLSTACSALEGVTVMNSLEIFLNSEPVKKAERLSELGKRWDAVKSSLDHEIDSEVIEFIESNAERILVGARVRHRAIPDDNGTATISMFGTPENIVIAEKDEWARGFLTYKVTFDADVMIHFYVFRSDSFDVPSWVSVSFGDPDEEHYFDAEGDITVSVTLELSLEVNLREDYEDGEPILKSIDIDNKPQIEAQIED